MAANPITELTLESAPKEILAEFLGQWFDGAAHSVGTNGAVVFPKCAFNFDQGEAAQPIDADLSAEQKAAGISAEIRTLIQWRNEIARVTNDSISGEGKTVTDYVSFSFYVRTSKMPKGRGNYDASVIAQLLHAILTNPAAKFPLAGKGIRHLAPKKPQAISSTKFTERLLVCAAELFYTLGFDAASSGSSTPNTAMTTPIIFTKENPLINSLHLLGNYQWNTLKIIKSATVKAFAPLIDTVLTLEIAGSLTDTTITIPAGIANTEVAGTTTDLNITVAAGQTVRWIATAGPDDAADAAWMVQLTMQVQ